MYLTYRSTKSILSSMNKIEKLQLKKTFKHLLEKDVKLELKFLSTRTWVELEDADTTFGVMLFRLGQCEERVTEELLQDAVRVYRNELERKWGIK